MSNLQKTLQQKEQEVNKVQKEHEKVQKELTEVQNDIEEKSKQKGQINKSIEVLRGDLIIDENDKEASKKMEKFNKKLDDISKELEKLESKKQDIQQKKTETEQRLGTAKGERLKQEIINHEVGGQVKAKVVQQLGNTNYTTHSMLSGFKWDSWASEYGISKDITVDGESYVSHEDQQFLKDERHEAINKASVKANEITQKVVDYYNQLLEEEGISSHEEPNLLKNMAGKQEDK